jgi:predicted transcriptional regulator
MERETYLKKVFKGKDEFCKALKALHAEYVRIAAAKGRKKQTLSAAKVLGEMSGADDRIRIYREILRLENGGMTVKKAISAMMHGTYAARMRGVKPETWRRYFNDWRRHRVMDVKASVDKNHTSVEKSVDKNHTSVEKSVDKSKVSVDKSVEKKMSVDKTCENVCAILKANPRATLDQVAKTMKLSVRGVEQAVKRLKNAGHLRKVGGKKLGYWEVF